MAWEKSNLHDRLSLNPKLQQWRLSKESSPWLPIFPVSLACFDLPTAHNAFSSSTETQLDLSMTSKIKDVTIFGTVSIRWEGKRWIKVEHRGQFIKCLQVRCWPHSQIWSKAEPSAVPSREAQIHRHWCYKQRSSQQKLGKKSVKIISLGYCGDCVLRQKPQDFKNFYLHLQMEGCMVSCVSGLDQSFPFCKFFYFINKQLVLAWRKCVTSNSLNN